MGANENDFLGRLITDVGAFTRFRLPLRTYAFAVLRIQSEVPVIDVMLEDRPERVRDVVSHDTAHPLEPDESISAVTDAASSHAHRLRPSQVAVVIEPILVIRRVEQEIPIGVTPGLRRYLLEVVATIEDQPIVG